MTDQPLSSSGATDQPAAFVKPLRLLVMALVCVMVGYIAVLTAVGVSRTLRSEYVDNDFANYAAIARVIADGGLPYRDLWTTKPPVVFYALTPFVALLGNTVLALQVATLVLGVVFIGVAAGLAWELTRSKAASAVAALLALLYAVALEGPETTFLMATLSAAAMLIAARGRGRLVWMLTAGAVFAVAIMAKQPVAIEFPILLALAAYFAPGRRWRAAGGIVAGGLLGAGVLALWAVSNGIAEAMWFRAFEQNVQYVIAEDGRWHFREDAWALFNRYFLQHSLFYILPLVAFSVPALVSLGARERRNRLLLILAAWGVLTFIGASVGRGFRPPYYHQMLPAWISLAATSVLIVQRLRPRWQLLLAAAAFLFIFSFDQRFLRTFGSWEPRQTEDEQATARYLADHTQEGDCLWVWGGISLTTYLSGRDYCSSAILSGFMMDETAFPIVQNRVDYLRELIARPPALHVRDATNWGFYPELQNYADRYLRELVFERDKYQVYEVDMSAWHPAYARYGSEIALVGYDLIPPEGAVCAGDTLTLALTWEQLQTPASQYQMFAQMVTTDESAQIVGYDGVPADARPTNTWVDPGEIILGERFDLAIPADTAPGAYKLIAGLYDVETLDRLPAFDAQGQPLDTYAELQTVTVEKC